MKMQITSHKELITAFVTAYTSSVAGFFETGRLLVQIVDTIPNGLELVQEAIPGITGATLRGFLDIGRGRVYDKLFLAEGPGISRLRRCDIMLQKKHYDEPLPVLVTEQGKTTHLLVSIWDFTSEQADQVFDGRGIRSLEQQKQWVQSHNRPVNVALDQPYTVRAGKISFHKACTLSSAQMALLLAEMTK